MGISQKLMRLARPSRGQAAIQIDLVWDGGRQFVQGSADVRLSCDQLIVGRAAEGDILELR
jgi:hypothetical protein